MAELAPDGGLEAVVAWTDDRGDLRTSPVTGALGLASADGAAQVRLRLPSAGPTPEAHLPLAELREQVDGLGGGPTDQVVVARSGLGGVRLLPVVGIGRDGGMRTSSGKPLMLPPPLPADLRIPPIPHSALVGAGAAPRPSGHARADGPTRRPRVVAALSTAMAVTALAVGLTVTRDDATVVGTKVESASIERSAEADEGVDAVSDDGVVPSEPTSAPTDAEGEQPAGAEAAAPAGESAGSQQPAPSTKSRKRSRATTTTTKAERARTASKKTAPRPAAGSSWVTLFVIPRQPAATIPRAEPVAVANTPGSTPTTARPVTSPPATAPPATNPPTTSPPTLPPTTSPPPTDPPPTDPPTTTPPTTEPPVVLSVRVP